MKKLTSILLLAALLLTAAVALSACGHKCTFATTWSSDENAHWHACEDKSCTEIADKADHTWNAGEITTAATQEADGVKTFTCSVCNKTKTEAVAYTGMTSDEWSAMLATGVFQNFTYKEEATVSMTGMEMTSTMEYKFTDAKASMTVTSLGQSETSEFTDAVEIAALRETALEAIMAMAKYENYKYDAATKTYVLDGDSVVIEELETSLSSSTIKVENGKIVSMTYACTISEEGMSMEISSTITISNYGTTTIE